MRAALRRTLLASSCSWGLSFGCTCVLAANAAPAAALPTLESALSQLQSGDATGAAKSLKAITSADPNNAAAWRALGASETALRHFHAAISDYSRALELHSDSPKVFYQLGVAYAATRDSQRAFEWLGRAQASHRYDMTEISEDVDLAGLRKDSRFNALLPGAADFEQPFVEPVKIIREWRGEAAGD